MNRIVRLISVALCSLLAVGAVALAACGGGEIVKPEKSCLVQVEGGTGGGYYYVNTNCTVVAEVPEGKQFIKWVSGETDLSPNAEYTFTVTKNIKLKAVYADDIPDATVYAVSVRYGTGGGYYLSGTSVKITAGEYYGATFVEWVATYEGSEEAVSVSTESEFDYVVNKNVKLEAHYDAVQLETPNNANGEMFSISSNGAYEMDRNKNDNGDKKTAFVEGCAYLLYNAYELKEGTEDEYVLVGQAKAVPIPKEGEYYHYIWDLDETIHAGLKGGSGNIYQDETSAKDTIRKILNIELNKTYYISVQAKGGDDTPIDSEESAKFAVKF